MSGPFFLLFDSEKFTMLVYVWIRYGSDVVAGLKIGSGSAKHMPNGARFFTSSCVRSPARALEPSRNSFCPSLNLRAPRQVSCGTGVSGLAGTGPDLDQNGPQMFPYGS